MNPYQPPQSNVATAYAPAKPMNMKDLFLSFDGRINRSWYWAGIGIQTGIMIVAALVFMMGIGGNAGTILFGLVCLPMIYTGFAIGAKRWHDRDKSGWWNLIGLVPYIGGLWQLIECGCLEGTRGPNRYGPPLP